MGSKWCSEFGTLPSWIVFSFGGRSLVIRTVINQERYPVAVFPLDMVWELLPFIPHSVGHIWGIAFPWSPGQNHGKIL